MRTFVRRILPLVASLSLLGGLLPLGAPPAARAAGTISLTAANVLYSEAFSVLASSGTSSTLPNGWWLSETGSNANATYTAGTGTSTSGDTYSFGAASDSERAFGGLQSGSLTPTIGASFTNNTGESIVTLDIDYDCEMWRAGALNRGAADRLNFQYSLNATGLTSGTWVDVDSLDCHSANTSTTVGAKDGNAAGFRTAVGDSITGLSIAAGASFWLRWASFDISGSDDGLAVDDFELVPNPAAPTDPTGVGAVAPTTVSPGGQSLFTVAVTPGTNPASTGLSVSADLTTIGGAASQALLDNGIGGDAAAGDNVFSHLATVSNSTSTGNKMLPFTVSDAQARSSGGSISLNVVEPCGNPYTPIFTLQGSGAATTMAGSHATEGVVIGNYQGGSTTLRGFFIQDPAGDGDPLTSDGIFVFNGGATQTLAVGDRVRVNGSVAEFQGQTQVSMSSVLVCGGEHDVSPTDVDLPVAAPVAGVDYLERVEGMLVQFNQTLYVTEHFQLGRFGQVTMSSGGRLQQPTSIVDPGAPANAMQAANNLNRIIVDDDSQAQNPDPILFGRDGNPLSASNTLRGGDTATGVTGVMTWTWAGHSAGPNNWRVRPVSAMHGGVPDFQPTNTRPEVRPEVGGTVQVGALNLLNYFNTFTGCLNGLADTSPSTSDCRGASNAAEFDRQWPKTVAAIVGMDVDVLGIMEIENDGYGPGSAIAHLVDQLNAVAGAGSYAFIDADAGTGELDSLGTDAIKVGLIYRPADVTPVGDTAVLNTVAFVNGGDAQPRNRPSLAQAFSINGDGGTFVVDVNHLKSKGSACTALDAGDGQGNCNAVRTISAGLLADWLAGDPTGTGTSDVLIVGDLNSYAKEDPIGVLEDAGYTNLVDAFTGSGAFSFAFDGQWGYLDHALGSLTATSRVTGVVEWHINADEPSVLDYSQDFKSAGQLVSLYAPGQYRMSDHDPVIIGLDYSPSADKEAVLAVLETLLDGADATTAHRIQQAIDRLTESLTPEWWIGDDQLSLTHGHKVFVDEKKVVSELSKKALAGNSVAQDLVELILDVDRELALGEILRAEDAGGLQKDIDKAYVALAEGDARRADGNYGQAIDSWKHAWEKARKAQN